MSLIAEFVTHQNSKIEISTHKKAFYMDDKKYSVKSFKLTFAVDDPFSYVVNFNDRTLKGYIKKGYYDDGIFFLATISQSRIKLGHRGQTLKHVDKITIQDKGGVIRKTISQLSLK